MRYLLDTNIFVYAVQDRDSLSEDVAAILEDYDNTFYMSAESVKELIVAYRNKKLLNKKWKSAKELDLPRTRTDWHRPFLPSLQARAGL